MLITLQMMSILILNEIYGSWFIDLLNKHIGLPLLIVSSLMYTILLTILVQLKVHGQSGANKARGLLTYHFVLQHYVSMLKVKDKN